MRIEIISRLFIFSTLGVAISFGTLAHANELTVDKKTGLIILKEITVRIPKTLAPSIGERIRTDRLLDEAIKNSNRELQEQRREIARQAREHSRILREMQRSESLEQFQRRMAEFDSKVREKQRSESQEQFRRKMAEFDRKLREMQKRDMLVRFRRELPRHLPTRYSRAPLNKANPVYNIGENVVKVAGNSAISGKMANYTVFSARVLARVAGKFSASLGATLTKRLPNSSNYSLKPAKLGIAYSIAGDLGLKELQDQNSSANIPVSEKVRRAGVSATTAVLSYGSTHATILLTRSPSIGFVAGVATSIVVEPQIERITQRVGDKLGGFAWRVTSRLKGKP